MPYYFTVTKGHKAGVYSTWNECNEQLRGFNGAEFKMFDEKQKAHEFFSEGSKDDSTNLSLEDEVIEDMILEGTESEPEVNIFTDGACKMLKNGMRQAGFGVYIPSLDIKWSIPLSPPLTNNRAELSAIITAIKHFAVGSRLHILTDSSYAILIFTETGAKYKRKGYKSISIKGTKIVPNQDLVEQAVMLAESYKLRFTHVDAHTRGTDEYSLGNAMADKLAVAAAESCLPR